MRKSKRQSNKHALLGVFGLVIICGISQGILTPHKAISEQKSSQSYVVSTLTKESLEQPILASSYTSTSSLDVLSNGDKVIKTKTAYFDNEVQVYLAAEQAAKHVGEGEQMTKDLMAMAWTESRTFNYKAVGDGNKSWGAFQIHLGYHPDIKPEQATDPYWAATWTAERLIAKGWKTDREYAIRSHNGNPTQPQTLPYIASVNKYLSM